MQERPKFSQTRRGVSAVEFAIVLPVLVVLLFGMTELGHSISVHHQLEEAARAGCRIYSANGSTEQDIRDMVDATMVGTGIADYTVLLDPNDPTTVEDTMTPVSVEVRAAFEDFAWFGAPWFMEGKTLSSTCIMPYDAQEIDEGGGGGGPPPSG